MYGVLLTGARGRIQFRRVTEVPGSHAIYVSKPAEVAEIIQQAAESSI